MDEVVERADALSRERNLGRGSAPDPESIGGVQLAYRMSLLVAKQTRELEAMFQLFARVEPEGPMPPSGGSALRPPGLLNVYTLVQRHRPDLVVELGSGTSTVWIAYALAASRCGQVISIEHSERFAERTRAALRAHQEVSKHVEIRHAPLTRIRIGHEEYRWYEPDRLTDLSGIDLLVVDGPPGDTCPQARYPAVPMLLDRLSDNAVIVLDDASREHEQMIVARWLEEVPWLVRDPVILDDQAVLCYRPGHAPESTSSSRRRT
jgi:Methyltransferase domain